MGQNSEEPMNTTSTDTVAATTPEEIATTRAKLSRDIDELADKVTPTRILERRKEAARGGFASLRDRVMGSASSVTSRVGSVGGSVGDGATGTAQGVTDTAHGVVETIESRTEGNPLAAGLIAFGAGLLVSSLIPSSEREAHMSRSLVEAAEEHGQPLIDEAKSVGQDIGTHLKEAAGDAAQEIKATAEESIGRVKAESQSSAQAVKEETRPS
ncbi:conserved hypothetical protein [metagenome]|uniref:DUF3618 domain-containing protein n=1 Tax=metagenome TaxID=256318 RepID=A0A2P2C7G4_9ZZZZ